MKNTLFLLLLIAIFQLGFGQPKPKFIIHSHNDYEQNIPFWNAYQNNLQSVEVDVFLKDNQLFVAHEATKISNEKTLESLYLKPIQQAIDLKIGTFTQLQLLIDIKTEPIETLKNLVAVLDKYPSLTSSKNIQFVVSGNQPKAENFTAYASYIYFDYQDINTNLTAQQWLKVALISSNFKKFSDWNGKGKLPTDEYEKAKSLIDLSHRFGKPYRFWACPDSKRAWKTFLDMGLDIINTDMPYEASQYINSLEKRVFYNKEHSVVYQPTFASDKKKTAIKNVILMIGDGNGLSQISAATFANGGQLTLTQLRSIGFIKTQSSDDFTTDSAAGATAFATGQKTYNRSIGMDVYQKPLQNLTQLLAQNNYNSGFVTTDGITGATPACFYAHQLDRGMDETIAKDLANSNLSLFVGGGSEKFSAYFQNSKFNLLSSVSDISNSKSERIGFFISNKNVPGVLNGRSDILAQATQNSLSFLQTKKKPFFIMVEGSQIDTNGHSNNVGGIVTEGIDFDKAITQAIKFADATGNTLVVITADHETSGFSIPQGSLKDKMIEGDFTSFDHTATMVPVFAYGPHSDEFSGVYENTAIYDKIVALLKLKK